MTQLWLVRHGQTDWNLEGRFQGSRDIALNLSGQEQARQIAAQLKGEQFDAIYSSPLVRALRTAETIAAVHGMPVQVDPLLVEVRLGAWEGMLEAEIHQQYPQLERERLCNPLHTPPPGGETAAEVAERMALAADEIARTHPGGTVLLVSHGMALSTLICLTEGISLNRVFEFIPENALPVIVSWGSEREHDHA